MIDYRAEYQSMIRRVEQAQKAISPLITGRSKLAGIAGALNAVLDEAYERMNMAWDVLDGPQFSGPKHYTYRSQKAAELSLCYASITNAYDELCKLNVISKADKTEPTTNDLIQAQKARDREAKVSRRRPKRVLVELELERTA